MVTNYKKNKKIVLNKTPLRLSLVGGGTELPDYFKRYGGAVINTTINLFIVTKLESFTKYKLKINLGDAGKTKIFDTRSALTSNNYFKIHLAVYKYINKYYLASRCPSLCISTSSDIPTGSGLGASSTLTVSLIESFSSYFNLKISKKDIAEIAFTIEREDLGLKGGLQDHLSATYGGINLFQIDKKSKITVKKIEFQKQLLEKFKLSILLIYTGVARDSSKVIEENITNIKNGKNAYLQYLHFQKKNIKNIKKLTKQSNLIKLCKMINKNWNLKNKFIGQKFLHIKYLINKLKRNGVYACKFSGAGNGGFLMCIYNPFEYYKIKDVIKDNKNYYILKPSLYKYGSKSIIIKN